MNSFEFQSPKNKRLLPAICVVILISSLITGAGVYGYQKSQANSAQKNLQAEIDTLKTQLNQAKLSTPTASPEITTNWKTYTDSSTGLNFLYPKDLALNTDPAQKEKGLVFRISVHKMDKIPDAPLWYGPDAAKEEVSALTKGDLSQTKYGEKLLLLSNGAVGATALILRELSCESVMFTREAHIYHNGYQIIIGLSDLNVTTLKTNNPSYFAVDKNCSANYSTDPIWAKAEEFGIDIAAGKTDAQSLKWYSTFETILSTITFK